MPTRKKSIMPSLPGQERQQCVRFALAFAATIVIWAALHDVHLIGVEPRHFTEFHRELLPIRNHGLLAVQYAVVATLGPGLLFGFMAWAAARRGDSPKYPMGKVLGGFIAVLLFIEALLLGIGKYAESRHEQGLPPVYPPAFYPDQTPGILYTQTVNISAYLLAPVSGFGYLCVIFLMRKRFLILDRTLKPDSVVPGR